MGENQLAQGYLFLGPESVGKSLCALEFACALASDPDFLPSQYQPSPFDVSVVRPAVETKRGVTKTKSISAETIRDALLFLDRFPAVGRFRVVIIEDAHTLSPTAQNVLLKNLEEPKSTAVIILVTHEVGSILPTVLSRIEKIRFDYVPQAEIEKGMRALPLSQQGKALQIAPFFFSLGRPGMIIRAAGNPDRFREEQAKLERLFRLSTLSLTERMRLAEELAQNVPLVVRLLEWWLPGLHTQALKHTDPRLTASFFGLLEKVEETITLLKTTQSNARLLLEKLFFAI